MSRNMLFLCSLNLTKSMTEFQGSENVPEPTFHKTYTVYNLLSERKDGTQRKSSPNLIHVIVGMRFVSGPPLEALPT